MTKPSIPNCGFEKNLGCSCTLQMSLPIHATTRSRCSMPWTGHIEYRWSVAYRLLVMTQCSLVWFYQHLEGTCCHHLQKSIFLPWIKEYSVLPARSLQFLRDSQIKNLASSAKCKRSHSHIMANNTFLGAFAKLRKANTSFVMSVRPSARNSAPIGRIFMKFDIWVFLENLSQC